MPVCDISDYFTIRDSWIVHGSVQHKSYLVLVFWHIYTFLIKSYEYFTSALFV
ncbi:hypothetical protein BDZ97DRAFT_1852956 [Flammula alnicola]|nr:hypothetical protein BDZ97DRAFT_1852956 [Flammula alnicola]